MRLRSALLALTLFPAAAFSVAAHVPDGCTNIDDGGTVDEPADDVIVCTETQYLSCDATIADNGKVHDFVNSPTIPMVAEAPAASFQEGAGCGYPEDPLFLGTRQDTPFSMDFGTFFSTNVDTLTVELHDLGPWENAVYAANGNTVSLDVRISVDGAFPLGTETNESVDGTPSESPRTLSIPIEAELSETGLSSKYVFTVVNIHDALPDINSTFGGEQAFSSVLVTVEWPRTPHPLGSLPSDNVVPVWGATEVPASITLNGEVVGTVVDALAEVDAEA